MGNKVFLNKKFSDYLGEQRALLDIIVKFEPGVSPTPSVTPQPTVTPTNTGTPTPTPSITPSATPPVTPTMTPTPSPVLAAWSVYQTTFDCCGTSLSGTTGASVNFNGTPIPLTNLTSLSGPPDDTLYECIQVPVPGAGVIYEFTWTPPTGFRDCEEFATFEYDRTKWTLTTFNPGGPSWNAILEFYQGGSLVSSTTDTIILGTFTDVGGCTSTIRSLGFPGGVGYSIREEGILGAENGNEIATENLNRIEIEQCP